MAGYADRFDPETYSKDPPVAVLCEQGGAEAWMPERIYQRLTGIGRAYGLHYLMLVPGGSEPAWLDATQASGLGDELEFVAALVDDPLLHGWLTEIARVVACVARSGGRRTLRVESH